MPPASRTRADETNRRNPSVDLGRRRVNLGHPSVEFGRIRRMVPPPCSKKAIRPCFGARFWSPDGRGGRWSGLAARLFGSGIPCLAYSFKTGLTSERTLCAVRPGWRSLERSLGYQPATFQWAASTQWAARTQQAATSRPLRRPGLSDVPGPQSAWASDLLMGHGGGLCRHWGGLFRGGGLLRGRGKYRPA